MGLLMTQCHQDTRRLTGSDLLPPVGLVAAAPGASSAPGPSRTLDLRQPTPAPQSLAPGRPPPASVSLSPRVGDTLSSPTPAADRPSTSEGLPPLLVAVQGLLQLDRQVPTSWLC
ncbi:hypothetical protein Taro_018998 [Colocasia esculenta]|uniref:Uncharacterized protein n=1 Tax=Colocasia esculenta TaxID=4460 RepID=A0A843UK08_COLES|nr:hypothetical protein [Colocasia esculenta]